MKRAPAAAVALAAVACVAAVVRVGMLGPSLDVVAFRSSHNPQFDMYSVVAIVRAETVEEVSIEPVSGPVRIEGGTSMRDQPPGWQVNFQVMLVGGEAASGKVRVVQKGRGARTYDVDIGRAKQ